MSFKIKFTLLFVLGGLVLLSCGSGAEKDTELTDLLTSTIKEKTGYDLTFDLSPTGENEGDMVISTDLPIQSRAASGLILFETYLLLKNEDRSFDRYVLNDDQGNPLAAFSLDYLKLFEEKHQQSEKTLQAIISKDYAELDQLLDPQLFPDSTGIKMTAGFHNKFESMDYTFNGIELGEEGGDKYLMEVYEIEGAVVTITYKLTGSERVFGLNF